MTSYVRAMLAAIVVGAGCVSVNDEFTCANDTQCVRDGEQGVCESTGFCSFTDVACADSQRRYGAHSGALADTCVAGGTTTSSGGGAGGSTVSSSSGTVGTGGAVGDGYPGVVLADQPVLYYRLGEEAAPVAKDSSPSSLDGIYKGGVELSVAGAIAGDSDTAAGFNDADDTVETGLPESFEFAGKAPFTLEAWIKRDQTSTGALGKCAYANGGYTGYFFAYNGDPDYDVFIFVREAETIAVTAPPDGVYFHAVATFDGVTNVMYINGESVTSLVSEKDMTVTGSAFILGYSQNWGSFVGDLDEVAIYDKALTPARIRAHYEAGIGP